MNSPQGDIRPTNANDLANQTDPAMPTAELSLLELTVPSVDLAQGISSPNAGFLDISGQLSRATDADVTRFFATYQSLGSLEQIDFYDCPNVTDLSLRTIEENLARMPLLLSMRFGDTQVTDDAADKFADAHPAIAMIMDPAAKNADLEHSPYYAGRGNFSSCSGATPKSRSGSGLKS